MGAAGADLAGAGRLPGARTDGTGTRVFRDRRGLVPRPSLLGAIVSKAVAVEVDDVPEAQRTDLACLLSLVGDPMKMAGQLINKDRAQLRARSEMADADE